MWCHRPKKTRAFKNWHSAAMLIDPRKTRITLIWEEEAEIEETGITAKIEDITPQVTETVNVSNITGGM